MRKAVAKVLQYQTLLLQKNPQTGVPYKPWEAAMISFPGGRQTKHNAISRAYEAKKRHGETVGRLMRERGMTGKICAVLEEGLSALKPVIMSKYKDDDEMVMVPDHHERTRAALGGAEVMGDMNRNATVSAEANQYNLYISNLILEVKKAVEGNAVEAETVSAEVVETLPARKEKR